MVIIGEDTVSSCFFVFVILFFLHISLLSKHKSCLPFVYIFILHFLISNASFRMLCCYIIYCFLTLKFFTYDFSKYWFKMKKLMASLKMLFRILIIKKAFWTKHILKELQEQLVSLITYFVYFFFLLQGEIESKLYKEDPYS